MSKPFHSGRCLCGRVTFESSSDPLWTGYCHCASCRRHTASPVAAFAGFEAGSVHFSGETPQEYESSSGTWRSFCGRCGTPISYRSQRYPGEIHVYVGALDEPRRYAPAGHVHYGERLPWFDTKDTLVRHDETARS
ncbi:MAG TPA: GFA family protein [Aestuariivirgaceae bacterium]|jgi:hypothetical protein